jgi:hypothetical protein
MKPKDSETLNLRDVKRVECYLDELLPNAHELLGGVITVLEACWEGAVTDRDDLVNVLAGATAGLKVVGKLIGPESTRNMLHIVQALRADRAQEKQENANPAGVILFRPEAAK